MTETETRMEVEGESRLQLALRGAFMWTQRPRTGCLSLGTAGLIHCWGAVTCIVKCLAVPLNSPQPRVDTPDHAQTLPARPGVASAEERCSLRGGVTTDSTLSFPSVCIFCNEHLLLAKQK